MAEKDEAEEGGEKPPSSPEPAAKKTRGAVNASDREARLAEALRANLRRRKAAQKKETD